MLNKLVLILSLCLAGHVCSAWPVNPADISEVVLKNYPYEVWVLDQSDSVDRTNTSSQLPYGGYIHIVAPVSEDDFVVADTIDLSTDTAVLCMAKTGAFPVRPHMVSFDPSASYAAVAFVASGHVVFFDAASRKPMACLRTREGANGSRQAHMAYIADSQYTLVANQNGKYFERIRTNYVNGTFEWDGAIDLAGCVTSNGIACEDSVLRPDNAPICVTSPKHSTNTFVTLRGGGMFVVDYATMEIVGEYDTSVIAGNGCGAVEVGPWTMIDSGGGTASNLYGFEVYRFPSTGFSTSNPPNVPTPLTLATDVANGNGTTLQRDAHGAVQLKNRYVWVFDRAANTVTTFDFESNERKPMSEFSLVGKLSQDPTPDIAVVSPDGRNVFVALRGQKPLSGDPHVSIGSTPGLGIIHVDSVKKGTLYDILHMDNFVAGENYADPHGVALRCVH
ncbi:hypothetical protein HDU85_001673 [Gaertneriomyces sp. JEL0708]|nr:hypothetical protein HDU85_001673 [Gaertneriomyces sp. JEL0708]